LYGQLFEADAKYHMNHGTIQKIPLKNNIYRGESMKLASKIFIVLLILGSIVLAACQPAAKKIRIVMDATWPPFETLVMSI
jgi:hypothetical protein